MLSSQRSETGTDVEVERRQKIQYAAPEVTVLGRVDELTGSGGHNNDDGWGWTKTGVCQW